MKQIRIAFLLLLLLLVTAAWWWGHDPLTLRGKLDRFMQEQGLVQGSIAIVRLGRGGEPLYLKQTTLNRRSTPFTPRPVASLSKLLTAKTVGAIVDAGRLRLSDRLSELLPDLPYSDDPRYRNITLRHMLQHTAGFDHHVSDDPLFAESAGIRGCESAVRIAVARPLDHDPGKATRYSNVGYCLLGLVIERVTAQPYELAVRSRLLHHLAWNRLTLGPQGAEETQQVGHYSAAQWRDLGAAGGWFTDAVALGQVLASGQNSNLELRPSTPEPVGAFYYGLGWRVWTTSPRLLTHYGSLPGMFSFAMRRADATVVVAMFEGRPPDDERAAARLVQIFENHVP